MTCEWHMDTDDECHARAEYLIDTTHGGYACREHIGVFIAWVLNETNPTFPVTITGPADRS